MSGFQPPVVGLRERPRAFCIFFEELHEELVEELVVIELFAPGALEALEQGGDKTSFWMASSAFSAATSAASPAKRGITRLLRQPSGCGD